ncbi:MAG: hypothetical protein ACT4QE_01895, partial [Anaerolineales bacterium]
FRFVPVTGTLPKKAVWFNLTDCARRILQNNGPYHVTEALDNGNELNSRNIAHGISQFIMKFYGTPVSSGEVKQLADKQREKRRRGNTPQVQESKEAAWKRLTNILLASHSEPKVLADAGFRLSWYFPAVSESQREFFVLRLSQARDEEIANIIKAIHHVLSMNDERAADLLCDLLSYLPSPSVRLKQLAARRIVPADELEALFQAVEYFSQRFEVKFRRNTMKLYGVTEVDLP